MRRPYEKDAVKKRLEVCRLGLDAIEEDAERGQPALRASAASAPVYMNDVDLRTLFPLMGKKHCRQREPPSTVARAAFLAMNAR